MHRCLKLVGVATIVILSAAGNELISQPLDSTKDITEIREEWVKDWNAKQLNQILALYAQDAVFLPTTGQRIEGRKAIGDFLEPIMQASNRALSVKSIETEESNKVAYDSGTFEDMRGGGGATVTSGVSISPGVTIGAASSQKVEGTYLLVLKRGENGRWQIVQHAAIEAPPSTQKR